MRSKLGEKSVEDPSKRIARQVRLVATVGGRRAIGSPACARALAHTPVNCAIGTTAKKWQSRARRGKAHAARWRGEPSVNSHRRVCCFGLAVAAPRLLAIAERLCICCWCPGAPLVHFFGAGSSSSTSSSSSSARRLAGAKEEGGCLNGCLPVGDNRRVRAFAISQADFNACAL